MVSPYRFSDPSAPLLPAMRYFHPTPEHPSIRCRIGLRCSSARELVLSFRVQPVPDRHRTHRQQLSWGSVPFSASTVEARLPRVCLTRHLPTSGFLTLLPAYVFRSPPALFRAGNARRVFLQGFSPSQSLRPLSEPVTFVMLALCAK